MKTSLSVVLALGLSVALLLILSEGSVAQNPPDAGQPDQDPVPGSTIVVALYQEPESLYYYSEDYWSARSVFQAFLDGPIDVNAFAYEPVILEKLPSLHDGDAYTQTVTVHVGDLYVDQYGDVLTATEETEAVQIVATFALEDGILWSDGQPLTAADSAFAFTVDCHPDTPTYKYTCERTASYQALSDQVAVWTGLPGYADKGYYAHFWTPLPEHVLGALTPLEILESDYGRHPLGWGPFVVDEWIAGQSIRLTRNPNYWRPALPKVEHLEFRFMPDPNAALQALLRGEVHLLTSAATGQSRAQVLQYLDLEQQEALTTLITYSSGWEHLEFGIQPADGRLPFFAGIEVRQAVAYALNRQQMVDDVTYGGSIVPHGLVPPQNRFYPPPGVLTEYDYDPDAARALLEAAGWRDEDGDGIREAHGVSYQVPTWDWDTWTYGPTQTVTIEDGTPFRVSFQTTDAERRQLAGTQLQQDLAAVGIGVTLEFLPGRDLFLPGPNGPLWGRKFDLAEFTWTSGLEPPCDLYLGDTIPSQQTGWGGYNFSGFVDRQHDDACRAAAMSLDGSQSAPYYYEAQRILSEKLPVLPLFFGISVALGNPNLLDIQFEPGTNEIWKVEEWELTSRGQATAAGGGGVESVDGRTTILLDPGVVSETVNLTFTPWPVAPGGNLASIGHAFDLGATSAGSGEPAALLPGSTFTIEIHYADAELTTPLREESLALYYWDGDEWVVEPSFSLDTVNNVVSASPNHFSLWAVLGETNRVYLPVVMRSP